MRGTRVVLSAILLVFLLTAMGMAETMTNSHLSYTLGTDNVWIQGTTTDVNRQIAVMDLSVSFSDDPNLTGHSLASVYAIVSFNEAELEFIDPDPTGSWGGTANKLQLGAGLWKVWFIGATNRPVVPFSGFNVGSLKFYLKCGAPITGVSVTLVNDLEASYVTLDGIVETQSPSTLTGNVITGSSVQATVRIDDVTLANSILDEVTLPVIATTDYRLGRIEHRISFEPGKLHIIRVTSAQPWDGPISLTFEGPGNSVAVITATAPTGGFAEMTDQVLYNLVVQPQCPADHKNYSTGLSFPVLQSHMYTGNCLTYDASAYYEDATVNVTDHSQYIGRIPGDRILRKNVSRPVTLRIDRTNTYDAGFRTPTAGNGLLFNVDVKSNVLSYNRGGSTFLPDNAWFNLIERQSGDKYSFQQAPIADNSYAATSEATPLANLAFDWIWTRYTSPNWSTRIIRPEIIQTFDNSYGETQMQDNLYCRAGTAGPTGDGVLSYGPFADQFEIAMSELYTSGITSETNITYEDFKIRTNFNSPSGSFTISNVGSISLYSVNQYVDTVRNSPSSITVTLRPGIVPNEAHPDMYTTLFTVRIIKGYTCTYKQTYFSVPCGISNIQMADYFPIVRGAAPRVKCVNDSIIGGIDDPVRKSATGLPTEFALNQNYPNPFNPVTTISMALPSASDWKIYIFNIKGEVVKEFEGYSGAGYVNVQWDASGNASGVYFYKAVAGEYTAQKKMLLIK